MPSKKKKKKSGGRAKAKKTGSSDSRQKEKKQQASIDAQLEQSIGTKMEQLMVSSSDNSKMEQLKISSGDTSQPYDEASLLEAAIKLATAEKKALGSGASGKEDSPGHCHHGYAPGKDLFLVSDYCKIIDIKFNTGGRGLVDCIFAAVDAANERHPEVWHDDRKLKLAVSFFLLYGTENVLMGDLDYAQDYAFLAYYLQDFISIYKDNCKFKIDIAKQYELLYGDEHTVVKYLRKHIPCNCLDEKYKEVKHVTKLGVCWNPKCSLPNRRVKRSTMLCCDRCHYVNYCSRECQKADWSEHKEYCDIFVQKTPRDAAS